MQDLIDIKLFGGFQVSYQGQILNDFVSSKSRALLAYLYVTGKPQGRQVLAELLWGDMPDATASANLRVALSNLRRLVGSHLTITRASVAVCQDSPYQLDVEAFQHTLQDLTSRSLEANLSAVQHAIDLYNGDFLQGFHIRGGAPAFEEWVIWQREHLRQLALRTLYMLSMHLTAAGHYAPALDYTSRLLALEPWQEEAHRQMMLLLALTGNRTGALTQYQTCRRILAEELNTKPLPETNALYARIKALGQGQEKLPPSRTSNSQLFGREQEQGWLIQQWQNVYNRSSRLTLIEGEVGVGKTALIEAVLPIAGRSGALVLRARCHEFSETMPYQSIIDLLRGAMRQQPDRLRTLSPLWLQELHALLPELGEGRSGTMIEQHVNGQEPGRQRLFEAVCQLLLAITEQTPRESTAGAPSNRLQVTMSQQTPSSDRRPSPSPTKHRALVLFLDDLQWIDKASVELLRHIILHPNSPPVWIVGAYEHSAVALGHPLHRLRGWLAREGLVGVLQLERLQAPLVSEWLQNGLGLDAHEADHLTQHVMRRSLGNPLIVSHLLRMLRDQAQLELADRPSNLRIAWTTDLEEVPFAFREIILLKLGRLSPQARHVLYLASVLGQNFTLTTLRSVISADFPIAQTLIDCQDQGLLTVDSSGGYAFRHPMIREMVYQKASPWHKQQVFGHTATVAPSLNSEIRDN